jgi:hypothetical protein
LGLALQAAFHQSGLFGPQWLKRPQLASEPQAGAKITALGRTLQPLWQLLLPKP